MVGPSTSYLRPWIIWVRDSSSQRGICSSPTRGASRSSTKLKGSSTQISWCKSIWFSIGRVFRPPYKSIKLEAIAHTLGPRYRPEGCHEAGSVNQRLARASCFVDPSPQRRP